MLKDYEIIFYWSEEDGCYIANIEELEGCMAHGYTLQEAAQEIEIAGKMWLDSTIENGEIIPTPKHKKVA